MRTKDFNLEISNRLKWLREIKGYSSTVLADVIDMTPCGYLKIENGERMLSLENCALIAKFYGTTCDFIINGTFETNAVMFTESNLAKARKILADLNCLLAYTADRSMDLDVKPTEVYHDEAL